MSNVDSSKIIVYSTSWCGDCVRAKKVLKAHNVDYVEIDLAKHPEAVDVVLKVNNGSQSVPTIIFPDGSTLTEPANHVLIAKIKELA